MGPGEAGNHRSAHIGGDAGHGFEVARRGGGESRLEYVYLQSPQLMGDGYFLVGCEGDAGGLFPVAQGGVEDDQAVRVAHLRCSLRSRSRKSEVGSGRVVGIRRPAGEAREAPRMRGETHHLEPSTWYPTYPPPLSASRRL